MSLLWREQGLWRWAPLPLYVYDRNEVAFSLRSGAEMIFWINFLPDPDLFQWGINPCSQLLFHQMICHLLNCQKLVDFAFKLAGTVRNQIWFIEIRFQNSWHCLKKVQKFCEGHLLFWLQYQITDYLLIHPEQISPTKGLLWWWFVALISKRPYALRPGWCFLALDSLNIANIFQSCLKQFTSFNAILKSNECICKSTGASSCHSAEL